MHDENVNPGSGELEGRQFLIDCPCCGNEYDGNKRFVSELERRFDKFIAEIKGDKEPSITLAELAKIINMAAPLKGFPNPDLPGQRANETVRKYIADRVKKHIPYKQQEQKFLRNCGF